jgi:hypothetical protein
MKGVFAIVSAVACCAAAALPAAAATKPIKDLWATVNICDTPTHDNMMGVRASMPGDGEHTKMYMRFTAQYYDPGNQAWPTVKQNGVSDWIYVGSGDYARRQAGFTFAFRPLNGETFELRGVVDFKWTKGRRIVRTAHVLTKGGHPNTKAADPKNYSSALCQMS